MKEIEWVWYTRNTNVLKIIEAFTVNNLNLKIRISGSPSWHISLNTSQMFVLCVRYMYVSSVSGAAREPARGGRDDGGGGGRLHHGLLHRRPAHAKLPLDQRRHHAAQQPEVPHGRQFAHHPSRGAEWRRVVRVFRRKHAWVRETLHPATRERYVCRL